MLFQKLFKPADAAVGIQYVGAATNSGTSSGFTVQVSLTGLTGGIASSAAIGDVVVISIGVAGSTSIPAIPTVTGYTQVASPSASDTNGTRFYTGYKVLTSADTSVSYTWTASNGSSTAHVSVWRNVDTTYPLDVAAQSVGTSNTVLCNPPAITPLTSGSVIVASGAGAHSRGSGVTFTSSDLTEFRSAAASATYDSIVGAGYSQWGGGTFNPAQFGFSGTDSTAFSNASTTLALRPAGKVTIQDTFTGTDGTSIVSHAPETNLFNDAYRGVVTYSSSPAVQIISNTARGTNSSGSAVIIIETNTSDVVLICNVNKGGLSSTTGGNGIAFRWLGSTGYYADYLNMGATPSLRLKKFGPVTGDVAVVPFSFSSSTTYTMKAVLKGSSIKIYIDDVLYIDTTDSTYSGTEHGFSVGTDASGKSWADNLYIIPN